MHAGQDGDSNIILNHHSEIRLSGFVVELITAVWELFIAFYL